ncbi:MAG: potassium/proton antiporter [Nitratireductor sp.]|nr:potassium/proton antiporter [Nitratireductor sp.]
MQDLVVNNVFLLYVAAIVLLGILSSIAALRFGAPLLLVFLGIGMLLGEDGPGGLRFDSYVIAYLIGSAALAVILFDGGMRTRLSAIRSVAAPALALSTIGVLLTAGLTGLFAHYVIGLGWIISFLLGSIVASTDAAAVFFLLKSGGLKLRGRVGTVLETESATNDPMALFLTLALLDLALLGAAPNTASPFAGTVLLFFQQFALGALIGVASGFVLVSMLSRMPLPAGLQPLFVLATAITIFSVSTILNASGFLAVYLAGLVLGNRPVRAFPTLMRFMDSSTWMAQLVMFVVLGLLVTPSKMADYAYTALVVAIFLIFVARPLGVLASLAPFRFTITETTYVSWVGLRGAVSIFLATLPVLAGLPGAQLFFNLTFVVVLISLLAQGSSLGWAARRLKLALPDTAHSVNRFEIDLPGQQQLELVAYPVEAGCPYLSATYSAVWLKPVFVVRGDEVVSAEQAGPLTPGDYGYFLVPPDKVGRVDALFDTSATPLKASDLLGFAFDGGVDLRSLAEQYKFNLPNQLRELTATQAFEIEFGNVLNVGDRLDLGGVELVAVELAGDAVSQVVLELPEEPEWQDRFRDRLSRIAAVLRTRRRPS